METIKCPCCGGQTTNILNCDYCGSYLVQLAVKGASIDLGTFGPAASRIDKLQKALQSNLNTQIEARGMNYHIRTSIKCNENKVIICNPIAINEYFVQENSDRTIKKYALPQINFQKEEVGLILILQILDYNLYEKLQNSFDRKARVKEQVKLNWFKQTSVSKLFKHEKSPLFSTYLGIIGTLHTYYLNFGKDYAGAAVAISQLLYGTNQISPDDPQITISESNITEKEYQAKYKKFAQKIKKEDKKWLYTALFIVLLYGIPIFFSNNRDNVSVFVTQAAFVGPCFGAFLLYRFIGNLKRKL